MAARLKKRRLRQPLKNWFRSALVNCAGLILAVLVLGLTRHNFLKMFRRVFIMDMQWDGGADGAFVACDDELVAHVLAGVAAINGVGSDLEEETNIRIYSMSKETAALVVVEARRILGLSVDSLYD